MLAALDALATSPADPSGTVRILTPDGFGSYVLIPGLTEVRAEHPNLTFEVVTATKHDLLTGRDFDMAVTLEEPSQRSVVVRKLVDYQLHLYASRRCLAERAVITSLEDLRSHTVVWYVDVFLDVEPLRLLDRLLPGIQPRVQTNNISGHYQAVVHGVGIAPLPSYIAALDPDLVRVLPERFTARRSYWLVVPRELTQLARVKTLTTALYQIVRGNPELRSGDY